MTPEDLRQCEQLTKHTAVGNTGACWCGFKKFKIEPEGPVIRRCPFCNQEPHTKVSDVNREVKVEVFCVMEGCPAFSTVVPLERWNQRAPHEMSVAHIPSEEPIFVLRAQDALALLAVYTWIDIAEKKKVPEEKINGALADATAMQAWQDAHGNKMPD